MRSIDPATGKPYPRRKAMNWKYVAETIAYQREHRRLIRQGYQRLSGFTNLPWCSPDMSHVVVGSVIAHQGRSLYVKLQRVR